MNGIGEHDQADIARLTTAAAKAAEFGQWDVVAQCYRERGELLAAMRTPMREANELLRLDEQIRDRVRIVQALVRSLLDEATATRQRLHGLQLRLGAQSSAPGTVSMKA
jgi:hypothetical protein